MPSRCANKRSISRPSETPNPKLIYPFGALHTQPLRSLPITIIIYLSLGRHFKLYTTVAALTHQNALIHLQLVHFARTAARSTANYDPLGRDGSVPFVFAFGSLVSVR